MVRSSATLLAIAGSVSSVLAGGWGEAAGAWGDAASSTASSHGGFPVFTPCPDCPSKIAPPAITVSTQLQPVSTCSAPVTTFFKGKHHTKYPYSTWQWVSTTIPCHVSGSSSSSCLVTKTEECVPFSDYKTTVTSYSTSSYTTEELSTITSTPSASGWGETPAATVETSTYTATITTSSPVYTTISKEFCAPFKSIGPLAIPGYEGPGLCTVCGDKTKGLTQVATATDCRTGFGFASTSCVEYVETWTSVSSTPSTVAATETCSSHFSAPSAGDFTLTFPGTVPAQTWSADGGVITAAPSTFDIFVTKHCDGGWNDILTTVTTTVTVTLPGTTTTVEPTGGWPTWAPATTATTTPASTTPVATTPVATTPAPAASCTGSPVYLNLADAGSKYRKRSTSWVAISGGDATVVDSKDEASEFTVCDGNLYFDGKYVAYEWLDYSVFEVSATFTPGGATWAVANYGLTLTSSAYTIGGGAAAFCVSSDNSLFIEYTSTPSFACKTVTIWAVPIDSEWPFPSSSSTVTSSTATPTSSTATSTSSTETWSSTPTPDPSSDPEPIAAETTAAGAWKRSSHRSGLVHRVHF